MGSFIGDVSRLSIRARYGGGLSCDVASDRALSGPGDRQGAVQFVPAGPDPPAAPQGAHHPLPPASDRHLLVDVFYKLQGEVRIRERQGRPRLRLSPVCPPDGSLAGRAAIRLPFLGGFREINFTLPNAPPAA